MIKYILFVAVFLYFSSLTIISGQSVNEQPFNDKCSKLDCKYKKDVDKKQNDISYLNNILKEYYPQCLGSSIFQKVSVYAQKISPTYISSVGCAEYYYSINKMTKSIECYKTAINLSDDKVIIADLYLKIAHIYYRKLKNFQQARVNVENVFELRIRQSEAYLLMAEIYASSNISSDKTINASKYWLAVDMAQKAKSLAVSQDVINQSDNLIRLYSSMFPSAEQIKDNVQMKEGSPYRVGGWIGRSTICRSRL